MIAGIKQFFSDHLKTADDATEVESTHALNLATAALLIEVMRADFDVAAQERRVIQALLQERLDLNAEEITALFVLAEQEVVEAVSLFQFTALVDQELAYEDKMKVFEMLWQVVYVDQVLDKHEEYLMRKIADLLHLSHSDYIKSKLRVMPS